MELSVYNIKGEDTGRKVVLNDSIYALEPNDHAIYLDVKQYLANKRQGTHKSKERSEVSGSTRKLGRPTDQRMAMLRNLVTSLLENGRIETTVQKAKETQSIAEKMITLGKENTLHSRRQALAFITKEDVVTKLFAEIAPKYAERNGGYTKIYKIGPRRGDAAEMAIIELVD